MRRLEAARTLLREQGRARDAQGDAPANVVRLHATTQALRFALPRVSS